MTRFFYDTQALVYRIKIVEKELHPGRAYLLHLHECVQQINRIRQPTQRLPLRQRQEPIDGPTITVVTRQYYPSQSNGPSDSRKWIVKCVLKISWLPIEFVHFVEAENYGQYCGQRYCPSGQNDILRLQVYLYILTIDSILYNSRNIPLIRPAFFHGNCALGSRAALRSPTPQTAYASACTSAAFDQRCSALNWLWSGKP